MNALFLSVAAFLALAVVILGLQGYVVLAVALLALQMMALGVRAWRVDRAMVSALATARRSQAASFERQRQVLEQLEAVQGAVDRLSAQSCATVEVQPEPLKASRVDAVPDFATLLETVISNSHENARALVLTCRSRCNELTLTRKRCATVLLGEGLLGQQPQAFYHQIVIDAEALRFMAYEDRTWLKRALRWGHDTDILAVGSTSRPDAATGGMVADSLGQPVGVEEFLPGVVKVTNVRNGSATDQAVGKNLR